MHKCLKKEPLTTIMDKGSSHFRKCSEKFNTKETVSHFDYIYSYLILLPVLYDVC